MDDSKMTFLQNVLRFTTSHTDEANTGEKLERDMSPERKKWLSEAIDSISINPVDEIKKCIKVSENEEETEERRIEALETLRDWCEDLNFAIDFHKINSYNLINQLLNDKITEIRALTCELVGTLAQNNPYCQETLINDKYLPILLYKLDKDSDSVKVKALFAISCLIRDYEPGQQKLLEGNALDILIKSLSCQIEKVKIKCSFLISSICNNKAIKNALTQKRLISDLIHIYKQDDHQIHEHILSAINVLIDDNPEAIKQAKELENIDFKKLLKDRLRAIEQDPRHDEERNMASTIYRNLFEN
ncbi:Hsp70-binding 1 [Brachionus plicatilis]|uniref:Hsp70-binding 1 n=1 Tax=Brachionus plicatilis TaxID=10195 RepID=A0A3M7Q3A9_BRAPC|nr:Hsp70-binding 1 [Brachionus plicatilis]